MSLLLKSVVEESTKADLHTYVKVPVEKTLKNEIIYL